MNEVVAFALGATVGIIAGGICVYRIAVKVIKEHDEKHPHEY